MLLALCPPVHAGQISYNRQKSAASFSGVHTMNRLSLGLLQVALLLGHSLGLAAGCSKKDAPGPGKGVPGPDPREKPDAGLRKVARPDPEEKPDTPLAKEDPEVAAYFKKK